MHSDRKITFVPPVSMVNKVSAIKAIRTLTGLGLKEAKDASEMSGQTQVYIVNTGLTERDVDDQMRILRNEGFQVGPPIHKLLDELRNIGSQALLQGEDELANEILQLVLAEKLRRKP